MEPVKKIRICVLFGGHSTEYAVSLMSAASVLIHLDPKKYDVISVGITKTGEWHLYEGAPADLPNDAWLEKAPHRAALLPEFGGQLVVFKNYTYELHDIDVIFPVLHGKNGEDGTIQGLCALAGVPCVGSGVAASANCMDKVLTNTLLDANAIPHCRWTWVGRRQFLASPSAALDRIEEKLPYPIFVKPSRSGSSVGIAKAADREHLTLAIQNAAQYDDKIILEETVVGHEVELSVLGNDNPFVSCPGEILASNEFYDYNAKYVDNKSNLVIPAELPPHIVSQLRQLASRAFAALGCEGLARVDFFVRERDGELEPLVSEINTIPGFTSISMYAKLLAASGIPFAEVLDKLITLAMQAR